MLCALERKLGSLMTSQEILQISRLPLEALQHFPHQRNAEHLVGHSCTLGKPLHSRMEGILHLNLHTLDLHGWISGLLACGVILSKRQDRKSTRLNSSHLVISYAVFCLKKKKNT